MPDDDEIPVPEMIAPRAYRDLQRGLTNDAIWRQQTKVANISQQQPIPAAVSSAVATLTSALNGIGVVSTSCQAAGPGPVYLSLNLTQVTALVAKLTTSIL